MSFIKRICVLFVVTLIMFMGSVMLLMAIQLIAPVEFAKGIIIAFGYEKGRIILGVVAGIILTVNFLFFRYFSVNVRREKIIAFENSGGHVSVSLWAMEDLIKRMLLKLSEVKDVRPTIRASKKGLNVHLRLDLKSDVNIPELTADIQKRVTHKIQDTIGIDEKIDIAIYVGKIAPESSREKDVNRDQSIDEQGPTIPFQGYRA